MMPHTYVQYEVDQPRPCRARPPISIYRALRPATCRLFRFPARFVACQLPRARSCQTPTVSERPLDRACSRRFNLMRSICCAASWTETGRDHFSLSIVPAGRTDLESLTLPANLYIHHLYVLVSKILSSILNSSAPIHPLSTLSTVGSKYIHV
jgi:hypothetical protein